MPEHKEQSSEGVRPEATVLYVSPDLLQFDARNPRFAGELNGKSQQQIQQYIFGKPHYASQLVDSFLENGFIDYEPLIVKRHAKKYVVIEGNRRLAAINEIRGRPDVYDRRAKELESVPVLVFPDSSDEQQRKDMRVYLGVRHLLGFREWPPISKAQFLDRESRTQGGLDRVIKEVRIKRQDARRFLVPYRLLKRANIVLPGEDFWVLGEALNRGGVKKFLQLEVEPKSLQVLSFDKRRLNLLLNDLYGPKRRGTQRRDVSSRTLQDTRDLKRLSDVLSSDKASAVLHSGKSLEEAEIYVDTREQSLRRLQKLSRDLGVVLHKIAAPKKTAEAKQLLDGFKKFDSALKAFLNKNA